MKKLLTLLGTLLITSSTTGSILSTGLDHDYRKITNLQKNGIKITDNKNIGITQQDTIYIDKDGKEQTTSQTNLLDLDITEIIQIGFHKGDFKQICAVKMPKTIKKVPNQLPHEITNVMFMFADAKWFNQDLSKWDVSNVIHMGAMFTHASSFNQDLSTWDVSNVVEMNYMFDGAKSFNQDLSKWNVSNVKWWNNFATNSGITDPSKLPKFNKLNINFMQN